MSASQLRNLSRVDGGSDKGRHRASENGVAQTRVSRTDLCDTAAGSGPAQGGVAGRAMGLDSDGTAWSNT